MAGAIYDRDGNLLLPETEDEQHDFDSKCLRRGVFAGMTLDAAFFDDCELVGADFRGSDLYWARFFRANCSGADFTNAEFRGATLDCANLVGAIFVNATLGRDNLTIPTSLLGADLTEADLRGANLEGAEYNDLTRFPLGFDPNAAGMVWSDVIW